MTFISKKKEVISDLERRGQEESDKKGRQKDRREESMAETYSGLDMRTPGYNRHERWYKNAREGAKKRSSVNKRRTHCIKSSREKRKNETPMNRRQIKDKKKVR